MCAKIGQRLLDFDTERENVLCVYDVHPPIYSLGQFSETFEWTEHAVNFL